MKYLILIPIKIYWKIVPAQKRRHCIFKCSCSNYVYQTTEKEGIIKVIKAFIFRFKNCRSGNEIFINPITNETELILINGKILSNKEISTNLL